MKRLSVLRAITLIAGTRATSCNLTAVPKMGTTQKHQRCPLVRLPHPLSQDFPLSRPPGVPGVGFAPGTADVSSIPHPCYLTPPKLLPFTFTNYDYML